MIHEGFAQHVSSALDAYLEPALRVKLDTLDQLSIRSIDSISTLLLCRSVSLNSMFVECDSEFVFPIIENVALEEREVQEIRPRVYPRSKMRSCWTWLFLFGASLNCVADA